MAVKVMLTLDDELHASIERMAEIQGLPKATLIRGLLEGQKPVIDAMIKTFEEVAAAHQCLESSEHIGKVVLEIKS